MALGKLSAGLAHELNNPASAIVRNSQSLKKHLNLQPDTFKRVIAIQMSPEQVDHVNSELFRILGEKRTARLSLRERSKKENEITDWLDENAVDNSTDMAENFLAFGFTTADLESFRSQIPAAFPVACI